MTDTSPYYIVFQVQRDNTLKMGSYFMYISADIRDINRYITPIYHPDISADIVHFFN